MYSFYLGGVLFPVFPQKFNLKVNNKNKTVTLINEGEINILKQAGLSDISCDILLPNVRYPWAYYPSGFQRASYYMEELERMKQSGEPVQLVVVRQLPNGVRMFDTSVKVSVEGYTLEENASNGMDVNLTLNLKQYKDYGVKTYAVVESNKVSVSNTRETQNSPQPKKSSESYTVKAGDTLTNISKRFYGTTSNYNELAKVNGISNPNIIRVGQVLSIPVL